MVRCNGVKVRGGWPPTSCPLQRGVRPLILIPTMSQDPLIRLRGFNAFRHPAQALLKRGGFAINFLQTKCVIFQVDMCIGQARQDNTSPQICFFCTDIQQFIPAHCKNFAMINQHCTRSWQCSVHGVDAGVV